MALKISEELEYELIKCFRCGFCRATCPVFSQRVCEAWNARGRMLIMRAVQLNQLQVSRDVLERLYSCTLCKACEVTCPPRVKVAEVIERFRGELVERGLGPLEEQGVMAENLLKTSNIFGLEWASSPLLSSTMVKGLPLKAENLFFPGCSIAMYYPEAGGRLLKILKEAGLKVAVAREASCCGAPMKMLGFNKIFNTLLRRNIEFISRGGFRRVIVSCPMCYVSLKEVEEAVEGLTVQHLSEVFLKLINEGLLKPSKPINIKATFHDPCHLGRYLNIYEAPREVVKSIPSLKLIEMERSKELSQCCGGPIRIPFAELRAEMTEKIVKNAINIGASHIITACVTCLHNLRIIAPDYDVTPIMLEDLIAYSTGVVDTLPSYE